MFQGIAALPEDVVHLIAAGEVIDSLAAVVRELAENALDAGATRITIALWLDHWRVRVADNGSGMHRDDLVQAAIAHSTSKIRQRQDLTHIKSLGFRGEALHSLAQLSHLQIASRPAVPSALERLGDDSPSNDSIEGWLALYDSQGQPKQLEPIAIAPGTVVTADNIFVSLPGRRQGLPSPAQQLRAIQLTIHQLALSHPSVTWQIQHNDRDWFTLFPGNSPRPILPQILRDVEESDFVETQVMVEAPSLPASAQSLYLLLGLPDRCHRHRPDWIKVAVNERFVQVPELEQTIMTAFRRSLPRDRFPVCIAHLQVAPAQVDWNRHPAKTEIYLHEMNVWREAISQAIDQSLRLNPDAMPEAMHTSRVSRLLKTAEAEGSYASEAASMEPSDISGASAPFLKVLAQVHNTYILVEHPTGVWLIEQHIAHERVLYEELRDRWQLVPLESPIVLNSLSPAQQAQLQRLGIELEAFGEQAWIVRTVPNLLRERADCGEALIELSLGGDLSTAQAAIACRSAIRNGTALTDAEMQTLIQQWQQTRNPRTCPHGRPICLALEESSLSRFFRRHWMIGKSHGI
ncbi:MAG: DNA mismatch repair endonuclease MutL [Leptolyngbyaceae cyanobacterium bins.302]|nr:DNA mismatch repair endonuclease MutL [Leptolyngbyaceae cyanobacterium bins.302]